MYYETHELYHHGIKGMRWGVRRFQNYDGTRTDAGKRRNATSSSVQTIANSTRDIVNETKKINDRYEKKKSSEKIEDDLSKMSDEELKKRVNRMNLEQQYRDLSSKAVSTGKSRTSEILETAGSVTAIASSAVAILVAIHKIKNGG